MMFVFLIFATTLHAQSVVLTIVNNSSDHTIWPAIEGSPLSEPTLSDGGVVSGDPLPEGLALLANSTVKVALPQTNWSGRLWARQYCSADGTGCVLGDCGSRSCWGRSSTLTTLFELTVLSDKIYYDISLVDGYTCGITVKPDDDACEPITCVAPPHLGMEDHRNRTCMKPTNTVAGASLTPAVVEQATRGSRRRVQRRTALRMMTEMPHSRAACAT
ncbi:Pathogenesis-related protein 5 [Colletotrichum fructicola Nara gc5]|uniref:Pathogenesis-related protein 5 n=2 Tax=Colletotrichum gloeosporioides species complex TaxID=2707338 RepID=A0A7J6IED1_COLFN|nr:Pathogenesis-related protein 5 [Colletotrichum fructicola Nara gc5]KAF4474391.1 Pathogenesis-related protein 5 [Colletotrichum fructicola Nara gc5]